MLANNNVFACSAKQARKWLKHGAEAWLATAKIEPQTTQALKHKVLNCLDRLQVKLPNSNKLDCDTLCKVHLEFPG